MAKTFFENFKEAENIIPRLRVQPYGANLPSPQYEENSGAWQGRLAIPFSYQKTKDGQRQYGIVYVPSFENTKFQEWGEISGGDVQTYGAELADGMSLTPEGFNKLYQNNKKSDFKWNDFAGLAIRQEADGKTYGVKTPVEDSQRFNTLRKMVRLAQKNDRENFLRNQNFYNNYRGATNRGR